MEENELSGSSPGYLSVGRFASQKAGELNILLIIKQNYSVTINAVCGTQKMESGDKVS